MPMIKLFKAKNSTPETWGRQRGTGGRPCFPWVFIYDTDKVEGSLMVLFFNLVFSVAPSSLEIFLPTPLPREARVHDSQ